MLWPGFRTRVWSFYDFKILQGIAEGPIMFMNASVLYCFCCCSCNFFCFVWDVEGIWRETWRKCPYVDIFKNGIDRNVIQNFIRIWWFRILMNLFPIKTEILNPLSVLVYPLFHLFLSYIYIYIYRYIKICKWIFCR